METKAAACLWQFFGGITGVEGHSFQRRGGLKKRDAANYSEIPVDAKTPLKSEED